VMAVGSVMISPWRHNEWTEKVIFERRDLVVYLPFVLFGQWQQETGHDFTTCSNVQIQAYEHHADVSKLLFLFLLGDLPSVSRLDGTQPTYNTDHKIWPDMNVEICRPVSIMTVSVDQWLSDFRAMLIKNCSFAALSDEYRKKLDPQM
jgi:hypothetical protein